MTRLEHYRQGRLWIDDRLIAALTARGHATPVLRWYQSEDDADAENALETLSMTIGTAELRMKVMEADLDRVAHDRVVQGRVAEMLDQFLDAFERRAR